MPWMLTLSGQASDVLAALPVQVQTLLASAAPGDVEQINSAAEFLTNDLATYTGGVAVNASGNGSFNVSIAISALGGFVTPTAPTAAAPAIQFAQPVSSASTAAPAES